MIRANLAAVAWMAAATQQRAGCVAQGLTGTVHDFALVAADDLAAADFVSGGQIQPTHKIPFRCEAAPVGATFWPSNQRLPAIRKTPPRDRKVPFAPET